MSTPTFVSKVLPSGANFVRFESLQAIFEFDDITTNPRGLGMSTVREEPESARRYFEERATFTKNKIALVSKAQKELSIDKEFLELVYKGKSQKRKFDLNKFTGNLSMSHYAANHDKIFKKSMPGAKKQTLNMAFQVGTFVGGNYSGSFTKILKTILMCQAMNISVNIDMFDLDTQAIGNKASYVMVNVAKSSEKLNFREILAASHREFFRMTLFNGYSASGDQRRIGTFLDQSRIIRDLGTMYDVIGGNILLDQAGHQEGSPLVSKILKIGMLR